MNVLKALAAIVSICNHHMMLLSNITPRYGYFTRSAKGMSCPFSARRAVTDFSRWEN
jgi:hypothetical protein